MGGVRRGSQSNNRFSRGNRNGIWKLICGITGFVFGLELSPRGVGGRFKAGIQQSTGKFLLRYSLTVLLLYHTIETFLSLFCSEIIWQKKIFVFFYPHTQHHYSRKSKISTMCHKFSLALVQNVASCCYCLFHYINWNNCQL